jgi:hypothetical protein
MWIMFGGVTALASLSFLITFGWGAGADGAWDWGWAAGAAAGLLPAHAVSSNVSVKQSPIKFRVLCIAVSSYAVIRTVH